DTLGHWSLTDMRDIFKMRQPDPPPLTKDIVAFEYFFDTDPGFGNGTSLLVTSGLDIDEDYVIDITSLSLGFHEIFFRVQDSDNIWSFTDKRDIFKMRQPDSPPPTKDVVAFEYFFDTDPGFGNGTSLPVTSGLDIDEDYVIDINSLSLGFHTIFFRVKDSDNIWSLTDKRDIFKIRQPDAPPPTKDVVAFEYFFDTDPGFGNGTSLPVTSGIDIDEDYVIDITSLSLGFHTIFFRVKDSDNIWGLTDKRDIFKISLPDSPPPTKDVVALEYFFDTDPGFGNGTSLPVTAGLDIDESYVIDITSLSLGVHKLFFRIKDSNNEWSLTDVRDVFKIALPNPAPLPDIVSVEYFIDTDPGFGNGTQISFTPNPLIDEDIVVDVSNTDVGMHFLFLRVKDSDNKWSLAFLEPFCVKGFQLNLEAVYDSVQGEMTTVLNDNGQLPLEQPYNANPSADWYYTGTESVDSIPNENIVDWLLIQARDATDVANATPATIKETKAVFLLNNGKIVDIDGSTPPEFSEVIENNLYVVIYHRNHLNVITAYPVDTSSYCGLTYNFAAGGSRVYGGDDAQKELSSGIWGLVSGDGNGDNQVNIADKNNVWGNDAGKSGYQFGDFNMNGQADNHDKNTLWIFNNGRNGHVPD
ncbi:MAG: hypothetical protein K8R37_13010, partial [Bacteroidales bacterium]|nr:hypothetical protein [Bacteroidales bacterium]